MSKVLKQTIKVIFSFAMLIIVFIGFAFANHSLAWFAKNENVSANGFSATAKVSPNLIIAKDTTSITNGDLVFGVDFNGTTREKMIAVTHDNDMPTTFLKYLTNHHAVDNVTGNKKEGATLEFESVPDTDNEAYFIDYTVYIASAFEQLAVDSLTASITIPASVDEEHPYFNAASIDFYVDEVSIENYCGTTSVASDTGVDLFKGQGGIVPLNSNGYIKVIMRCYFDGALQDSNGIAYINSNTVDSTTVSIGVEFEAIEN